jgi:hypothetical protein
MVTVGEENLADADPHDFSKVRAVRRHRINAEVARGVTDQVPVEVVPVRFGKPRPSKNIG